MIGIEKPAEPATFNAECRLPGNAWLAAHPTGTPPGQLWRPFVMALCAGFHNRCGYTAMWSLDGTVDHYLSQDNHRGSAFEWSNFRYIAGWLNSSKQALDRQVLDPFKVKDEWFEIDLQSLVLRLTPCVPNRVRPRAQFTLTRLHLADGDRVYNQRKTYYDLFTAGNLPLDVLHRFAPLLATAIRRERVLNHLAANPQISINEVTTLIETSRGDAMHLIRIWVRAEHLRIQGRGPGVRYLRK